MFSHNERTICGDDISIDGKTVIINAMYTQQQKELHTQVAIIVYVIYALNLPTSDVVLFLV